MTRPGDGGAAAPGSDPALAASEPGSGPWGRQNEAGASLPQEQRPGRTSRIAAGGTPPENTLRPEPSLLRTAGSAAPLGSRAPEIPPEPDAAASAASSGRAAPARQDTPVPVIRLEPAATPSPDTDAPGALVPLRGSAGGGRAQPGTAAATAAPRWRLRALPVCASSETELDRWLQQLVPDPQAPLLGPVAVIARRQRFGRGQQGRQWSSPAGGVWLSAALPWPADPVAAAAPGLAVAVGLALQLEALGLAVRLKWPNDLLIAGPSGRPAKLAGLLPRLRLHGGRIRWARVGIGLNGSNPVPPGATNLRAALNPGQLRPERLAARVLLALEWAMAVADQPTWVRQQAEARLLVAPRSWQGAAEGWQPHGLADDGALVLARGEERQLLRRRFEPE